MAQEQVKILILGGGPAGYTAAIYASRAGLKPVLYEGPQPGGQLMITSHVENFPGYPQAVDGPQMMLDFRKQAETFGTEIRQGTATAVDFSGYPHLVTIDHHYTLQAATVIIATGASAKWLGLASEKRLNGKGVSACALCDGFFFRNQDVAVVGGGDSAAEESLHLANLCAKVFLIVRREVMRASKIMQERVLQNPKITLLWNTEVQEILGQEAVEGLRLINNKTQSLSELTVQALFLAIGHVPNTTIFKGHLTLDDNGYIKTKPGTTYTNVPGVFAAGDVQDHVYRQAVTAAGTGCMAALDAERFLSTRQGIMSEPKDLS